MFRIRPTILAYYSRILNKISDFFLKNYILRVLVDFHLSLSWFFFGYPDPDRRFLILIRIRPNDTDPKHLKERIRVGINVNNKIVDRSLI